METTEEKRTAYVEAYDAAISDLVPDFDPAADKETDSPWCLSDYSDAIPVDNIEMVARAYAEKRAPEIARLIAADLENADDMPRVVLTDDDGAHHIYDVNNCLDVFGRCENGLDFEAIKTAFYRLKCPTSFEAFKRLAQSFEPIKSLDDLYEKMLVNHPSVMDKGSWSSDLPNFGGADLFGNDGVWSWDETRLIIGSFAGDLEIISREEFAERGSK